MLSRWAGLMIKYFRCFSNSILSDIVKTDHLLRHCIQSRGLCYSLGFQNYFPSLSVWTLIEGLPKWLVHEVSSTSTGWQPSMSSIWKRTCVCARLREKGAGLLTWRASTKWNGSHHSTCWNCFTYKLDEQKNIRIPKTKSALYRD